MKNCLWKLELVIHPTPAHRNNSSTTLNAIDNPLKRCYNHAVQKVCGAYYFGAFFRCIIGFVLHRLRMTTANHLLVNAIIINNSQHFRCF